MKGLGAWGLGLLIALSSAASPAGHSQHEGHQPSPGKPIAQPEQPSPPERVKGVEPIRCWRQASAGAITIGESFSVVLTCAVFESEDAQVVPDESRLNVASIQTAPFEILGGSHPADVRRGSRRFFQYDYQLRIISPDAIGHDVNVPALTISYRIHSRVGAAQKLEGRDLSYLLPALPIKVLSLVPADAADIRDSSDASLAAIESMRFRSRLFGMLAWALGALAAVMVVLAFVPLARRAGTQAGAEHDRLPDRAVLARAAEELADVQANVTAAGWTDAALSRALGAARLVAAFAVGRRISQKPGVAGAPVPEGRLLVMHGRLKRSAGTVSSAATPDDVARAVADAVSMTPARSRQLDALKSGLAALTAALYCQAPVRDAVLLDEAVRHAASLATELAAERHWWKLQWARR